VTYAAAAVAILVSCSVSGGCGNSVEIEYSQSPTQPVIVLASSQALPPEYAPHGADLMIYGDGTVIKKTGLYHYESGRIGEQELAALLTSIVDKGFFGLPAEGSAGQPGGVTQHVTVALKGRSKRVSAPGTQGGAFGRIVDGIKAVNVPDAREYVPESLVLYANALEGSSVAAGAKVVDWTLDPGLLTGATAQSAAGKSVSGSQAEAVWKELASAYSSDTSTEILFRADGKLFGSVYVVPQFPMPGV
jgi:hypothetical protein